MQLEPASAWIDFDARVVTLDDGVVLPIQHVFDRKMRVTTDPDQAAFVMAGAGDDWVNLRLYREYDA